ncbi:hypothetical protein CEXT_608071 [Caerostris extrusa]|uniref:Uncharacterized protein n=1 Tax=Caerostris extrusa TaxID=172846 RepID=A0AAV4NG02_CAEEX|nr:hypothetical protein CEXT_608071 [Caerostris extrusa]
MVHLVRASAAMHVWGRNNMSRHPDGRRLQLLFSSIRPVLSTFDKLISPTQLDVIKCVKIIANEMIAEVRSGTFDDTGRRDSTEGFDELSSPAVLLRFESRWLSNC